MHGSLTRLRRDAVDLLQLHNRVMPEPGRRSLGVAQILGRGGVADALERMIEQGLTRHAGFTALGDAAACREVIESRRFASAQVYHNLLNPSAGRAMPAAWSGYDFQNLMASCAEHGVAVMNIRVRAAGVIATDTRHGREGALVPGTDVAQDEARTGAVFAELRERYGTRAQTAIRYALSNAHVSGVLVGIAETGQIDEALAAIELGPLPDDGLGLSQASFTRLLRHLSGQAVDVGSINRWAVGRRSVPPATTALLKILAMLPKVKLQRLVKDADTAHQD